MAEQPTPKNPTPLGWKVKLNEPKPRPLAKVQAEPTPRKSTSL